MKKFVLLILFVLNLNLVSALQITEIMYHPPSELGGNYNEWVEIYNNDPIPINLENFTLQDKNFDDFIIQPNSYLVIAEKLTGDKSFESFYGNNNSVWDEDFDAVDASSFSLPDSPDLVNISNGIIEFSLAYNPELGGDDNGYSLELISNVLIESSVYGGTPGYQTVVDNETQEENVSDGNLNISVSITNSIPTITNIILLPDESSDQGIQIFPNIDSNKTFNLTVFVRDNNGADDIRDVFIDFKNSSVQLDELQSDNLTKQFFKELSLSSNESSGAYNITITVADNSGSEVYSSISFNFLSLLSFSLTTDHIDFGSLPPGTTSEHRDLGILNQGNTPFDIEISGTNLRNHDYYIEPSHIEAFFTDWTSLSLNPQSFATNTPPGLSTQFNLRFNVPLGFVADSYLGSLTVAAVER